MQNYDETCDKQLKNKAWYVSHVNSKQHRINERNNLVGRKTENNERISINYKDVISTLIKHNDITEYEGFEISVYLTYIEEFKEQDKLVNENKLKVFQNI